MTSKERVLAAAARQQPDRTPLDFSANEFVLQRLHSDLGIPTLRGLIDRFHVDIVDIRGVVDPVYRGPTPAGTPAGKAPSFWSIWGMNQVVMQTATGPERCFCDFALASANSMEELERYPWPSADDFSFDGFAERLEGWQDLAVMASGASMFQHPSFIRGLDNLLADFFTEPEMAHYLIERFAAFYVRYFDRMLTAARGRIDILRIADDLGMQDRLLFSPETFDEFFAPPLRRIIDMAHSHGVKVMFHSCGAIVPLIPRLIGLKVDILDPIQVRAAGMDAAVLKRDFGGRICLHGSIDTQYLLPHGTPQDVACTARQMIEILGQGGGFIMAPSHVLQTDVPTKNIVALYDSVI